MRLTLLVHAMMTLPMVLLAGGCLVEYVLPEGSSGGASTGDGAVTDAGVTGTGGAATDATGPTSGDACAAGLSACGGDCVDLTRDDAHCGACGEYCKADERCIVSECRDIFMVECAACPCDACPDGTLDPGDGDDPQRSRCCPKPRGSQTVVCVVADLDAADELVCPE